MRSPFGSVIEDFPEYVDEARRQELRSSPISLSAQFLVPLIIAELREKGGPDDADMARAHSYVPELVGPGSEALTVPGCGHLASGLLSKMCFGLAVLAYQPGGVRFCGIRYQAQPGEWEAVAPQGMSG